MRNPWDILCRPDPGNTRHEICSNDNARNLKNQEIKISDLENVNAHNKSRDCNTIIWELFKACLSKTSERRAVDLHEAIMQGDIERAMRKLDKGANINFPLIDETPLMKALKYRQTEIARAILKRGPELDYQSNV